MREAKPVTRIRGRARNEYRIREKGSFLVSALKEKGSQKVNKEI